MRSNDHINILDPAHNAVSFENLPTRDPNVPYARPNEHTPLFPSPYWGEEIIWDGVNEDF
jgi:hypothetical protein